MACGPCQGRTGVAREGVTRGGFGSTVVRSDRGPSSRRVHESVLGGRHRRGVGPRAVRAGGGGSVLGGIGCLRPVGGETSREVARILSGDGSGWVGILDWCRGRSPAGESAESGSDPAGGRAGCEPRAVGREGAPRGVGGTGGWGPSGEGWGSGCRPSGAVGEWGRDPLSGRENGEDGAHEPLGEAGPWVPRRRPVGRDSLGRGVGRKVGGRAPPEGTALRVALSVRRGFGPVRPGGGGSRRRPRSAGRCGGRGGGVGPLEDPAVGLEAVVEDPDPGPFGGAR